MPEPDITCDRCSAPIPADASTCPNCGAPLNENAATGFETTKLEDMFSTTKLDSLPDDLEMPAPEQTSQPEPPEPEPTIPESPHAEPTVAVAAPLEPEPEALPSLAGAEAQKEWYQKPITWIIGGCALALFACCCVVIIAAAVIAQASGI